MICVTGDLHGDIARLKHKTIKRLKRGDSLIVCGDFGFLWDNSAEEQKTLAKLGKLKFNILFVEGTHDNMDLIAACPTVEKFGGKMRHVGGNIYNLMRGELYEIEGKRVFSMGGGESHDADIRVPGLTWWPSESPTRAECEYALKKLEEAGGKVDIIVTHEASRSMRSFLDMTLDADGYTPLNDYFDTLEQKAEYRCWFFGAYHIDKKIPPRHIAVFKDVLELI